MPTLTLNSVHGSNDSLLDFSGTLTRKNIGEYIDFVVNSPTNLVDTATLAGSTIYWMPDTTVQILSADANAQISWKPIVGLVRSDPTVNQENPALTSSMVTIVLSSGRMLTLSQQSNVMRRLQNQLLPAALSTISIGSYIPISTQVALRTLVSKNVIQSVSSLQQDPMSTVPDVVTLTWGSQDLQRGMIPTFASVCVNPEDQLVLAAIEGEQVFYDLVTAITPISNQDTVPYLYDIIVQDNFSFNLYNGIVVPSASFK